MLALLLLLVFAGHRSRCRLKMARRHGPVLGLPGHKLVVVGSFFFVRSVRRWNGPRSPLERLLSLSKTDVA